MQGETVLQTVAGQGVESLNPGKYTVEHKQRSALWYAPAEYFTSRGLPVPPEGVKERYLRGALGDFALFLDQMTPLHNGPIWSKELGGVRFDESDISRIYYQVEVGAPVEVR
jgi:lipoprotein-anchoring transpeptidase ErfK/SrfK